MQYVGYVYKIHCLITNKDYIGITTQNINRRQNQHKNESLGNQEFKDNHFHRAIRKYGWEQFEKSILLKIEADNYDTLRESLDELESFYIKKYDTYNNGYNSTYGGSGVICDTNNKKVLVFNELGEFIEECESRVVAASKYSVLPTSVSDCCNRIILSSGWKNNLRIIFRNEGDTVTEEDIERIRKARKNKQVPVKCYDFNTGELLGTYPSIVEASNQTGIDSDSISKCALHKIKSTIQGGKKLVWRKDNEEYTPIYTIEAFYGDLSLGRYVSTSHASDVFNVPVKYISEYLCGKRKSAGKYNGENIIWKRI